MCLWHKQYNFCDTRIQNKLSDTCCTLLHCFRYCKISRHEKILSTRREICTYAEYIHGTRPSRTIKNIGGWNEESSEIGDAVLFIDAFELAVEPPRSFQRNSPRCVIHKCIKYGVLFLIYPYFWRIISFVRAWMPGNRLSRFIGLRRLMTAHSEERFYIQTI